MRKFGILVLMTLILACEQPDDSLSGDFVLNNGGGILLPMEEAVTPPAFRSREEFWTVKRPEKRVLSRYGLNGTKEETLTLYHVPSPDGIGVMDISHDGQTAFFTMNYDGLFTNTIATLQFYSSDHDAFFLNSASNYVLPNPANVYCTALDYDGSSELVYLGNYYDTGLGTVDQSIYVYELGVGLSATVPVTQNLSYDSDLTVQGEAASCVDGRADDTGSVSEFAVAVRNEREDGTVAVFRVYDTDGNMNYDSSGTYEFQEIGGLQWLGEESMVLCVKSDGRWKIVMGNSSGDLKTLYTADGGVYRMEGLDLSPDGERVTSRVLYDESGDRNEILLLNID